jgi:hypothetical protein
MIDNELRKRIVEYHVYSFCHCRPCKREDPTYCPMLIRLTWEDRDIIREIVQLRREMHIAEQYVDFYIQIEEDIRKILKMMLKAKNMDKPNRIIIEAAPLWTQEVFFHAARSARGMFAGIVDFDYVKEEILDSPRIDNADGMKYLQEIIKDQQQFKNVEWFDELILLQGDISFLEKEFGCPFEIRMSDETGFKKARPRKPAIYME